MLPGLSPAADIDDARSLWAGFDPRRDPLEIEIVRAWDEESFRIEELYFTGETWQGEKARVFAFRGTPSGPPESGSGARVPGVLHIHGGGQTASVEWVKYWCRRGYACVSFDFCGKHPTRAGPHTLWGRVKGDMMTVGGGRILEPDARHCPWFHWALASRRALTLLEEHHRVDGGRLGIFGISVGGTLTWIVAGTDDRVKAAVPIYGCGWDSYSRPWDDPSEPVNEELALWRRALAAETYAPLVRCPVFFLSSTNDHHGLMDRSFRTLDLSPAAEKRASFTPQYIHHIDREEARGLALWMDWHLKGGPAWPAEPRIELVAGAGGGAPEVRVTPADPGEVESVAVHYALSNPWPQSRHWRRAPVSLSGDRHRAPIPYFSKDDTIHVFAAVKYRSGAKPSSRLVSREVRFLHGTEPTLRAEDLIDPMTEIGSWYYGPAYTDPWREDRYFEPWEGPAGERGFTLSSALFADPMTFEIATHQLGDPQWRRKGRGALLIDALDARRPGKLEVKAIERQWQPGHKEFRGPASYGAARDGWVEIRIEPDGLEGPEARKLPGWDEVDCLVLLGSCPRGRPPVFRRLRWES